MKKQDSVAEGSLKNKSAQGRLLELDVRHKTVHYDGQEVAVRARYFDFVLLVAQKSLAQGRNERRVHVSEIHAWSAFRQSTEESLGQSIYRFLKGSPSVYGFNQRIQDIRKITTGGLIMSPERKSKEVWELNQEWVSELKITGELEQELRPPPLLKATPAELLGLLRLEMALELGDITDLLEATPDLSTSDNVAVAGHAALLRCGAFELQQNWDKAWAELDRAETFLKTAPKGLQMRLVLQKARLERLIGSSEESARLLRSLWANIANMPTDSQLQGRLEVLEGLLILDDSIQEPKQALKHFYQAAQHFLEAHWHWGLVQLYANIGLTYLKQSRHPLSQNVSLRLPLLTSGKEAFLESLRCCEVLRREPEAGVLTLLAHLERELGELSQAQQHLQQALAKPLTPHDEAQARIELGEVYWSQEYPILAQEQWQEALDLPLTPEIIYRLRLTIGNRLDSDHESAI